MLTLFQLNYLVEKEREGITSLLASSFGLPKEYLFPDTGKIIDEKTNLRVEKKNGKINC